MAPPFDSYHIILARADKLYVTIPRYSKESIVVGGVMFMRKVSIFTGALIGGLLMAALVALMFLGDQLFGLPLAPFDILDWTARTLPGGIITFGIDTMVNTLRLLNIPVREAAKTAEQAMAVGMLLATGVVLGLALYALLRWRRIEAGERVGLGLGLLFGLIVSLVSLNVNQTATVGPVVGVAWLLLGFGAWGWLLGWSYDRLAAAPVAAEATEPTTVMSFEQIDRRSFLLRMGAGTAAVTVVGAGLAAAVSTRSRGGVGATASAPAPTAEPLVPGGDPTLGAAALLNPLPNAGAMPDPAPGTRPEYTPLEDHYRIDINARPPSVDADSWVLPIMGMVDNPVELSLADLEGNYEPVHRFVTLSCISNPLGGDLISTTLWTGARLQDVLADVGVQPGARYLIVRSRDGFYESVDLDLVNSDDRIMLTYHWDGIPLEDQHGFPLRIYIPDRYGMKQPKWIESIEVSDTYQPGYWVERGWSETAQVRMTSVVDTVAADSAYESDGQMLVPVGGIAYAGARSVSRVEVRVDDGDWQEAELRDPLANTTWVVWRYDWPFEAGNHTFAVRSVDGDGTPQVAESNPVRPNGATGIDELSATV